MRGLYDRLLSGFIVSEFSYQGAFETALRLFGSSKVRFAGVDGTMYLRSLFDLMIFFGGAYAATGSIEFRKDARHMVEFDSKFVKEGAGVSSAAFFLERKGPIFNLKKDDRKEVSYLVRTQPYEFRANFKSETK